MNHDISQPVPQGSDGAQDAENSRIAAIANVPLNKWLKAKVSGFP